MTVYEAIKNMSLEELAKFLLELDAGIIPFPTIYACDSMSMYECYTVRHCAECYEMFLKKEVENV